MILAVDFDGVLHDYKHPIEGRKMGAPMPGAQKAMEKLHEAGHNLIVHTVRGNSRYIVEWLDYYDVPYHEVTDKKPNATYYIDDKAIKHTDWLTTMGELDG